MEMAKGQEGQKGCALRTSFLDTSMEMLPLIRFWAEYLCLDNS